jgi:hypothetical protein
LIEATAGTRIDESGASIAMDDTVRRLREIASVATGGGDEWWSRWARWFFSGGKPPRAAAR